MCLLKKITTGLFATSLALGLFSCSSTSKKETDDKQSTASTTSSTQNNEMENLKASMVQFGDSDHSKAGGIETVNFGYDSSKIDSRSEAVLSANAEILKKINTLKIQIEGHCDERGSEQYNLGLGQRRANSVKKYLEGLGISSDRITTTSFGKERPVELGHNELAWSKNRRANFVITEL